MPKSSDSVWHEGVKMLLDGRKPNHDNVWETRAAALRRHAERYGENSLVPWPRLAQSFLRDAEALERMIEDRKLKLVSKAA